ncbi:hypothetical protein ACHAWF_016667, partial [Thalassiosira exigua]
MAPEAIFFLLVAGVSPLVGLWTAVILGFFAALFVQEFVGRVVICHYKSLLSQLVEIYQCPITHTVMANPSIVDGPCHHTVSREPAAEWYRRGSLV